MCEKLAIKGKKFTVRIENFPECFSNGVIQSRYLGVVGNYTWWLYTQITPNTHNKLSVSIVRGNADTDDDDDYMPEVVLDTVCGICLVQKDKPDNYAWRTKDFHQETNNNVTFKYKATFAEMMDDRNGYLHENQSLEFNVKLRVKMMKSWDGTKKCLNLYDPFSIDCFKFLVGNDVLYVSKQFISFHSPVIRSLIKSGINQINVKKTGTDIKICCFHIILQKLHGLLMNEPFCCARLETVLKFAYYLKMDGFIRSIDLHRRIFYKNDGQLSSLVAIRCRMKFCLKDCINAIESKDVMKSFIRSIQMEKVSAEILARITQKMFSFSKV